MSIFFSTYHVHEHIDFHKQKSLSSLIAFSIIIHVLQTNILYFVLIQKSATISYKYIYMFGVWIAYASVLTIKIIISSTWAASVWRKIQEACPICSFDTGPDNDKPYIFMHDQSLIQNSIKEHMDIEKRK